MTIKDFKGKGKVNIRVANLTKEQKERLLNNEMIKDVYLELEINELKVNEK